jgi:hypothetical protein
VNDLFLEAVHRAGQAVAERPSIVETCLQEMTQLVYQYFDIDATERVLIEDTNQVLVRSARRKRASERIPTLQPSTAANRGQYARLLCETLNDWAKDGPFTVTAHVHSGGTTGLGIAVLTKVRKGDHPLPSTELDSIVPVLERLQRLYRKTLGSIEVVRDVKVFDQDSLYIIKPLSQRFWTRTAALNDADEIAATIIMRADREKV